jgi:hypothetical protein
VFVHGLTVIAERPDGKLEIAMPRVNGHAYRAGSWLAETPIERGTRVELQGVTGGTANIYNTGFLANVPRPFTVTQRRRHATVIVPKPIEILGFLRAGDVELHTTPPLRSPTLAEMLVLVYDYADANQVLLQGHYWQPSTTPDSISLHLISTSEVPEGAQHIADTEDALSEVFLHYPGMQYNVRPGPAWMDSKHPNFGNLAGRRESRGSVLEPNDNFAFSLAELENPAARARRLERLGRMHRQMRRIDCLWNRPDPICADEGACTSVTGIIP